MIALAGLVALIPGAGSLWGFVVSALGALVRCKPCLYALATAALCGWTAIHVHRADRAACETRIETRLTSAREAAAAAAIDRDASVRADLEKSYGPAMEALRRLAGGLQEKVNDYAKRKPPAAAPGVKAIDKPGACRLGAAAGLLQRPSAAR